MNTTTIHLTDMPYAADLAFAIFTEENNPESMLYYTASADMAQEFTVNLETLEKRATARFRGWNHEGLYVTLDAEIELISGSTLSFKEFASHWCPATANDNRCRYCNRLSKLDVSGFCISCGAPA